MTIRPRTLSGFRDFLPASMLAREQLIDTVRRVYRSYGFSPIDTPALEYLEILQGKGGEESDRQIYRFKDHGGREVGLRFDLTVPLARFMAQHAGELGTPFKRYHIAKVWRGERPQRGRYREFMQCDFDTIGTKSVAADIEMVLVIHDLLEAIGIERFTIRVNDRRVLNGMLESVGLADQSSQVLRAIDKLEKIGREKVAEEMAATAATSQSQARQVLDFVSVSGSSDEILQQLSRHLTDSELGQQGLDSLGAVARGVAAAGIAPQRVQLDVSIARGLDYYTGTVVETSLDQLPSIGSVCSGGRYDNLAEVYTKQELPGIGASLGLDRLLAALAELDPSQPATKPAQVLVAFFDADRLNDYLALAAKIQSHGIAVELYPDPKKIGQQLKYAASNGFRVAVIAGDRELEAGTCQVKDLENRTSCEVEIDAAGADVVAHIAQILLARILTPRGSVRNAG